MEAFSQLRFLHFDDSSLCQVDTQNKPITEARQWFLIPLIPALGRQRQVDLSEFKASLVYKKSSRTPRLLHRETLS